MAQNNRETGSYYETAVAACLEKSGMTVIEKNFRCRAGEIDLVARDGNYLVFVEVKYRKNASAGTALEAVDRKKAAQVRRVAAHYLYRHNLPEETACRFDVAAVDGGGLTYIKDAF